jgi:hypothetical protein
MILPFFFITRLHFELYFDIICLILVFTGGEEKNPVFRGPSPNGNSILGGSPPSTHAAAAAVKSVMHSCVLLVGAILLGRISLVLLNG